MKKVLSAITILFLINSCGIFRSNRPGPAIGAEKLDAMSQKGFKPKNAKERAEQKAVLKQLKRDEKLARSQKEVY